MSEPRTTRWAQLTGGASGEAYAGRFAALAASGADVHGEASYAASLVPPPARVLDAGCGTGRVAARLAELGYDCTGVDVDPSMLAVARREHPGPVWVLADLADLADLGGLDEAGAVVAGGYDLVLAAGNVIPLLAEGALQPTVAELARVLAPSGLLVCGFGLDAARLPPGCPVTPLSAYDRACDVAGLAPVRRLASWDGVPYDGGGYAVSVHAPAGIVHSAQP
jgi:SAM-dependent methyltransferase